MADHVCCSRFPENTRRTKPLLELGKWAAPGAAFLLIPKCPLCIAAYLTAVTGMGFTVSTAGTIRSGAVAACVIALAYLVGKGFYERINIPPKSGMDRI